jgi:hypothetical protein
LNGTIFKKRKGTGGWYEFVFDSARLEIGRMYYAQVKITAGNGHPVKWLGLPDYGVYPGHAYYGSRTTGGDFALEPFYTVSIAETAANVWAGRMVRFTTVLPGAAVFLLLAAWLAITGLFLAEAGEN